MFRDGQYLEVIKISNGCLVTVVVTVQERTVEIRKRKVITNKWLEIEDWAALYKILKRAVLQNSQGDESRREDRGERCKWKKSIRQLEVTYTFEPLECTNDATSIQAMPTIKVYVSAKKSTKQKTSNETLKKSKKMKRTHSSTVKQIEEVKFPNKMRNNKDNRLRKIAEEPTQREDAKIKKNRKYMFSCKKHQENTPLEEYIPHAPKAKTLCSDFEYVPSRKSELESKRSTSDEYTPGLFADSNHDDNNTIMNYIPNSIEKSETTYETYEPCAMTTIPDDVLEKYVPNSKGAKSSVEEYEPDFKSPSKLMKFDDSYVPSSVIRLSDPNESKKALEKLKTPELC